LIAIIIGQNLSEVAKDAIAYGADDVILVEADEYQHYNTDGYTKVLAELIDTRKPSVVLIGATSNGRDLAPRVACRLKTGLTADCTDLVIDEESGNVAWTRPAFSGNFMALIVCPHTRPQMGTVRPGVFKKAKPDYSRKGKMILQSIPTPQEQIRTKLVEFIKPPTCLMYILKRQRSLFRVAEVLATPENLLCYEI